MAKVFNVNGACKPQKHYMVDLGSRLRAIKAMVDAGEYFTINRARQYGKTTTLRALAQYLAKDYLVVSMDFQRLSESKFKTENTFSTAFGRDFVRKLSLNGGSDLAESLRIALREDPGAIELFELFDYLSDICDNSDKPVVLMIDEVDTASNNQIFLDFLAQLRAAYLDSDITPTFQSVILAGVTDIRSIKRKIRPDEDAKNNSPWNIAAKFNVDMNFAGDEIKEMLEQYESDYRTGMDTGKIARLIYGYTSGYPYLVSAICKLIDEEIAETEVFPDRPSAWTEEGFYEAEKMLVREDNTLYQSLIGKLKQFPMLRTLVGDLLFNGRTMTYTETADYIKDAAMYGFIKNENNRAVISNRIFEAVLYEHFIAEEQIESRMFDAGRRESNQFIVSGHLDVKRILVKFIETFNELYGKMDDKFIEDVGRKYFILFLKPIINGVGNYSIESKTRNNERMDVVIYYRGERYILELKIWRGDAYNERGEEQLTGYLDYFGLKKGYMLSFNFNKNKETGIQEIAIGDKTVVEAVV